MQVIEVVCAPFMLLYGNSSSSRGTLMKSRVPGLLIFMCMFAAFVIAQSVDGKWAGEVQGGRGPQAVTLMLKADGGKLTGTASGGRGGDVPIWKARSRRRR